MNKGSDFIVIWTSGWKHVRKFSVAGIMGKSHGPIIYSDSGVSVSAFKGTHTFEQVHGTFGSQGPTDHINKAPNRDPADKSP